VALVRTDFSDEGIASIIRVKGISVFPLLAIANVVPSAASFRSDDEGDIFL
jgi:hypothetical protein